MRFLRLILLVIVSFILAFGLVVMANNFRVYSFARFASNAAFLTPIICLLIYLLTRIYPLPERFCPLRYNRTGALLVTGVAFTLSFLLVPQYEDAWRYLLTVLMVALTLFLWSVIALLPFINGRDGYLEKIFLYFSLLVGGIGLVLFLYMCQHARMYGDVQRRRVVYSWLREDEKAERCTACRECEERCPQGIAVSEWMKAVRETLGSG